MKDPSTNKIERFSKNAGLMLALLTLIYTAPVEAQGRSNNQNGRNNRNDASRGQISRSPSIRQQPQRISPRQNNSPRALTRSNPRILADNNTSRNINPAQNNRRSYNSPNRNSINNQRPGTVYNRPGNSTSQLNRRPGINNNNYNNNYRRPGVRYNNYRRPIYNAYNPNWRYAYAPRRYSMFNTLPSFYFNLNFGGSRYRYYDGIYYQPYNNIFRVVAPPIGIFVNVLPRGHRKIYVNDYPYYYYNGTYYNQKEDNYYVVSPPVGAVVESIPDGYKTITIDGETFYEVDGAQYKPAVQENGEVWYEVIKSNKD